ncbi:hypothetical protein [Nonomuraea turcica]|uniref:hypothetical protein n=1 Tax=Nonomuraea sp. G32 TaxID=3067274 RepID=UPI00273B5836|nr:hypothetical protein [Nonomuraea sp. G32]MDP4500499.1 hypothetical protein [Nonomuraea sp. G32]
MAQEITQFVERVPEDASCVATGSLIEGIGNANSDIDLYIIQGSPGSASRPVSIGIRGSRYVDCEYLNIGAIEQLAARFDPSSAGHSPSRFTLRDIDRYYRLAIAARLTVSDEVATVLDRCSKGRSCQVLAEWSLARAYEYLARSDVEHALGRGDRALVSLREAALWRSTSVLAAAGEGYPSLKWATVKAARLFGTGTATYRDCLYGASALPDDFAIVRKWLRERVVVSAGVLQEFTGQRWDLNPEVAVVVDGGALHLVLGRKSIAQVAGTAGLIITRLCEGRPWQEAVGMVAGACDIPVEYVLTASYRHMHELAAAGYLIAPAGKEVTS